MLITGASSSFPRAVIADFDIASNPFGGYCTRATLRTGAMAPEEYRPPCSPSCRPERHACGLGETAGDMYALGVLILKAMTNPTAQVERTQGSRWSQPPNLVNDHPLLSSLLENLLSCDTQARRSAESVLLDPFFSGLGQLQKIFEGVEQVRHCSAQMETDLGVAWEAAAQAQERARLADTATALAMQKLDEHKLEAEQARGEVQQRFLGRIVSTPPYWRHPSTAGGFFEVQDITQENGEDMQMLLDSATDKAHGGGSKIGIGKDANGMNHRRFKVIKVERVENATCYYAYNAFRSNLPELSTDRRSES